MNKFIMSGVSGTCEMIPFHIRFISVVYGTLFAQDWPNLRWGRFKIIQQFSQENLNKFDQIQDNTNQTQIYHSNNRRVWYSDGHCIKYARILLFQFVFTKYVITTALFLS